MIFNRRICQIGLIHILLSEPETFVTKRRLPKVPFSRRWFVISISFKEVPFKK